MLLDWGFIQSTFGLYMSLVNLSQTFHVPINAIWVTIRYYFLFIYFFCNSWFKILGARGHFGMVGPSVGLDLQQITNILCEAPRFPQIFIMFIVFITQTIFSLNDQKPCLLLPSFFVYIIFYFTFI